MKKYSGYLSFILCLVFGANTLSADQTTLMLCSGVHENGSRVNIQITKFWHHLEPGMEPATSYEVSFAYIGENSSGQWRAEGSMMNGHFFLGEHKVIDALKRKQLSYIEERKNLRYFLNFELNLVTNDAFISHHSGTSVNFELPLQCTGEL